ncbi:glycosyltransferase family 4 protein [Nonomuraea sp. NPDC049784]|uniref:glycosyltransferase family 4 protein n=1 Tax=Nonomuraea sp. NPDC049784 TaxID=3154361 RepID=UPI00340C3C15
MAPRDGSGLQRITLLIGQLGLGGTETQVSLLARELHGRGFVVDVVLLSKGGPHEATLRAAGVGVHHVGFSRRSPGQGPLTRNLRIFVRLVWLLRRLRPDVLHAFVLESYTLGAPAALLARAPIVIAGRRRLSDIKQRRRLWFTLGGAVTRITDHVVANARAVAEDAMTVEGIPSHKLSVIYNGLPDSAFDSVEPAAIDTDLPVVVCLARLRQVKGHRFLLDAAALLAEQGTPCTLVLVGDGPEEDKIKEYASGLDIDVRFVGPVTDSRAWLARADVVVLPSISEGFSNAIMEAMAQSRPIVATAVGGTPELLADRGVLVPPADPVALSLGIAKLLCDQELAVLLGDAARAWAAKHLDATTMVEEHVKLYRRLLER